MGKSKQESLSILRTHFTERGVYSNANSSRRRITLRAKHGVRRFGLKTFPADRRGIPASGSPAFSVTPA